VLQKEPVFLLEYLKTAVELQALAAETKGVQLRIEQSDTCDENDMICIDPARMNQAIRCIIHDALQFVSSGSTMSIQIETSKDNNRNSSVDGRIPVLDCSKKVIVSFIYNGSTRRSLDDMNGLLEMNSVLNSICKDLDNAKLTLFIAKGLIGLHGGRVWAESRAEGSQTYSRDGGSVGDAVDPEEGLREVAGTSQKRTTVSVIRLEVPLFVESEDGTIALPLTQSFLHRVPPQRVPVSSSCKCSVVEPLSRRMSTVSGCDADLQRLLPSPVIVVDSPKERPMRTPLTILVVDDSVMNRKMLVKSLQLDNHTCYEADDGENAVSLVIQYRVVSLDRRKSMTKIELKGMGSASVTEKFDVILMDSEMPRMSGPEAANKMRRIGYTGVIIAITGDTNLENNAEFLIEGADEVLHKPVSREKVNETLERLVYAKRRAEARAKKGRAVSIAETHNSIGSRNLVNDCVEKGLDAVIPLGAA
jgi:CheY-like chemotaxis protein